MEWGQVLAIAAINVGLIAWLRMDMKDMRTEMKDFHAAMKDFHGRLCKLEEKYQQMMQRFWENK